MSFWMKKGVKIGRMEEHEHTNSSSIDFFTNPNAQFPVYPSFPQISMVEPSSSE
jgi:hypothetical protein